MCMTHARTSLCTFGHGKGVEPRKIVSAKQDAKGQRGRGGAQRTDLKGNAPIKTVALGFVVSGSRQRGKGGNGVGGRQL